MGVTGRALLGMLLGKQVWGNEGLDVFGTLVISL